MERELFFLFSLYKMQVLICFLLNKEIIERVMLYLRLGQSKGVNETSYLVKDDILLPLKGEIPLFLFGFLY